MNEHENMMTEEYFEHSGCGCMVIVATVVLVAMAVAFIILCTT